MQESTTNLAGTADGTHSYLFIALAFFFITFAIGLVIFLIIRSILLWYWKVNVIVRNQEYQTSLLEVQNHLLSEQNKILTNFNEQMRNNPIDPNK